MPYCLSSTRPALNDVSGRVEASYGSYDMLLLRAIYEPAALGSRRAFAFSTTFSHTDGFYTDVTRDRPLNGSTSKGGKANLLLALDGGATAQLIVDYTRGAGNCCYATSPVVVGPLQPLIDSLIVEAGGTVPSKNPQDREQSLNGDGRETIEDYGAALIVEAEALGGTLRSITGYRHYSVDQIDMDPDFSGADIFRYDESFRSRFVSQEMTLSIPIKRFRGTLLLGAFLSDERLEMGRKLPWGSQAQPVWDALLSGLGLPAGTADASPGLIGDEDMGGSARDLLGLRPWRGAPHQHAEHPPAASATRLRTRQAGSLIAFTGPPRPSRSGCSASNRVLRMTAGTTMARSAARWAWNSSRQPPT